MSNSTAGPWHTTIANPTINVIRLGGRQGRCFLVDQTNVAKRTKCVKCCLNYGRTFNTVMIFAMRVILFRMFIEARVS